jgi:starch phosphorylase
MYLFGKINVTPQLPERISELSNIACNLWWSWNTYSLRLFDYIDASLFLKSNKNPVKFLSQINQKRLLEVSNDIEFLKEYDMVVENFKNYINNEDTYYNNNFPSEKNNVIAYFSAEYGLDEIFPIYAGGLGILSGDHCKSASDLGLPFVPVGLLYKHGYFNQRINKDGWETFEYSEANVSDLPIQPAYDENGNELVIQIDFPGRILNLKVWQIKVGRITLYLLDSDIDLNSNEDKELTLKLYGGNQETRICQEIILGVGGMKLLETLHISPTIYHMNEGHSSFVVFEVIKKFMKDKNVSFEIAKEMASASTIFTTHTPVPAGTDIFPIQLIEKYFYNYPEIFGISKNDFISMGLKYGNVNNQGFNMAILALKIAGKKNGVSKLHGEVSRELFGELWPDVVSSEVPITYVTNGAHTGTWLASNLKDLYNAYMRPFWQDKIYDPEVWEDVDNIPDTELWNMHFRQKQKLIKAVRENIKNQKLRQGASVDEINDIEKALDPNILTIGFARRFATYKRADLIFRDLERITEILNDRDKPVQIIFAGKPHPADVQGQELVKKIYEISNMPQFKGKVFILENYNMHIARYLVSGVDVWLNNPRRPMEASGTSGEKAGLNGVINFSILDGWWYEGYNGENGWAIGDETEYTNYELQDNADSQSMYNILENEIIPLYYERDSNNISPKWIKKMKNSIKSVGGVYNTSRMLCDYIEKLYIPQIRLVNSSYSRIDEIQNYITWKKSICENWSNISITSTNNLSEINTNAGVNIEVSCIAHLGNILPSSIAIEVYYGKFSDDGKMQDGYYKEMELSNKIGENDYEYKTNLVIDNGGNYGYTFRAMPTHQMIINKQDMALNKWIMN